MITCVKKFVSQQWERKIWVPFISDTTSYHEMLWVLKPRDLNLELPDRSEIWQAHRQKCCLCACQISKRWDDLKGESRGFETSRDLMIRRLIRYGNGALLFTWQILHRLGGLISVHGDPTLLKKHQYACAFYIGPKNFNRHRNIKVTLNKCKTVLNSYEFCRQ